MQSRNAHHYFEKASMYGMLADYYKYCNPTLHIYYYKKHLNSLQKAIASQRSVMGTDSTETPAKVRILHAAPDAPNVDVYINGTRILKDFPYKKITDYLPLPQGKYQVDIYPTGNQVSTIISRKVEVQNGKIYTLAATGNGKNLKLLTYEDHPIVPHGEAKVRFIHLAPDAPAVDIAVKHGDIIFPNIAYRKATNYLGVTPMNIDLEAREAGTKTVMLELPNVDLKPNTVYSIYIIGSIEGTPALEALILIP
ncbi:DUF4397 domain-containing protein [Bacillus massiliigorillae]|uniref:DUF4397 domain-containing protein n=1 Tax=Bacillus massiliigorillae TaxID=1243664 RepID=UPI0003A0929F|nr:DUF4397 domain-containing protein [Bacillus massiliigorillae]